MRGNLKALGLALLAAFAMSAVMASAAQATPAQFTADAYPAVGTGKEVAGTVNKLESTAGTSISCGNVIYEATQGEASTELTVTPHYTSCETNSGIGVTVDLNGCHYKFTAGTKAAHGSTGSVHIICPTGTEITVTAAGCTIHVPPQTLNGVTYTNEVNGDVKVDVNINTLTTTETDHSAFLCFFGATEIHVTNGLFQSTVLFECFKDLGNHSGTTDNPGTNHDTKTTYTEGAATDCSIS